MKQWVILLLAAALSAPAQTTGIGLKGDYFNTLDLTGPVEVSRTDTTVNFQWSRSPALGVDANNFSVRWSGQVLAPTTAAYTFSTLSDDGVRLWVNGAKVIDNWTNHSATTNNSAAINLVGGQKYDIKMEYFQGTGRATAKLLWNTPGQAALVIPQSQLFPPSTTFVSDLTWTLALNGNGTVARDKSFGGQALTIGGVKFAKGLGTLASSDVRYNLSGQYDVFTSSIGIDDEISSAKGSSIFQVWLDGVKVYQSDTLKGANSARFIRVIVTGKNELRLVVTDGGDGAAGDHADWADAQLGKGGVTLDPYLSDLDWTSADNGLGPVERDKSNGGTAAGDGVPLSINGMKFAKGLGVRSTSDVRFALGGKFASFATWMGIDDEVGDTHGSAVFQVWLDGVKAFESPELFGKSDAQKLVLSVAGKNELRLVVTNGGDGGSYDHADWGGAQLFHAAVTPTPIPPSAPPAPTNLTASAGDAKVTLSWTSSAGAASYMVYRGGVSIATSVMTNSYTDTGLTNGTTYSYKVAAVNAGGTSGFSNDSSAKPEPGIPSAPTNLTAAAGDSKVVLSWTASAGASSYTIFRDGASIHTGVTSLTDTNTGLTNGTAYTYKVAAVNGGGTSGFSNAVTVTPEPTVPPAPTDLKATPGDTKVVLTWTASAGAASYSVFRGGVSIATGLTAATFTNTGLTNGTAYTYKVAAVNGGGTSGFSSDATATPEPPAPSAPTDVKATPGDTKVMLTWTAPSGAVTYNVTRGGTSVATGLTATTFTDTGLTNGTAYTYKVAAVNGGGTGPLSSGVTATPVPPTPPAPASLTATAGDTKVMLSWTASAGATSYSIFRGITAGGESTTAIATGITVTTYTNNNLTNGKAYFYKVAAVNLGGAGSPSNEASATPEPPVPSAPTNLKAKAGDTQIVLSWSGASGATNFNIYRGTAAGAEAATPIATGVTTGTFTDTGLTNGVQQFYKVAGVDGGGIGPQSAEATATPVPPIPAAPTGLAASPGNGQVTLIWNASAGSASYNVYRGSTSGSEGSTPVATGILVTTFTDTGLVNGPTDYYKVAAVNLGGTSPKSTEASTAPVAPPAAPPAGWVSASRLLRQTTWGPTPALVNHVIQVGPSAFLDEQFAATPSDYPDSLKTDGSLEPLEERFFQNALNGQDQLRQRVAFALSQIFVVSGVKVSDPNAMVPYQKMLLNNAFGNYYDVLRTVSLTPAMGEFLDMVNNQKADPVKGLSPNENYAREIMQLFSIGLVMLNPDGTPMTNGGATIPTYDQSSVTNMARVFTGWTYGDNKAGQPTKQNPPFYNGPMEAVEKLHDTGAKTALGQPIAAGLTTAQDLDAALTILFNHQNTGPFICKQLIEHLVTSNPSPAYVQRIAAVFANNGVGVRGDLKAVVKAIVLDPEAALGQPTSGHLREPALFLTNLLRGLNASVVDHPFVSDKSEEMSERIFYAPSVFNYFSPSFKTSGGITGPEFQIFTTATSLIRIDFVSTLLDGGFGSDVTLDLTPYLNVLPDTSAMLDQVNFNLMGGLMSQQMRNSILAAVAATPTNKEKVWTAVYLTTTSSQYQVEN